MKLENLKDRLESKGVYGLDINEKTLSYEFVKSILNSSTITYETKELEQGKKITLCHCQLPNGFVLTETSSCVNPLKYSEKMGVESCMERFENEIWKLYGFFLQEFDFLAEK